MWLSTQARPDARAEPPALCSGWAGGQQPRRAGERSSARRSPCPQSRPHLPVPGPIMPRRRRKPHTPGAVCARGAGRGGQGKSPLGRVRGPPPSALRPGHRGRREPPGNRPAPGGGAAAAAARTPERRGGDGRAPGSADRDPP